VTEEAGSKGLATVRQEGFCPVFANEGLVDAFKNGADLRARDHVGGVAPVDSPDSADHGAGALGLGRGRAYGAGLDVTTAPD
jgi:hypothetical protein